MSVKIVASLSPLDARHIMVLANRRKTSVSSIIEAAVQEHLSTNPVEGLDHKPLNELLVNKGLETTITQPPSTDWEESAEVEQQQAVAAAQEMVKRPTEVSQSETPAVQPLKKKRPVKRTTRAVFRQSDDGIVLRKVKGDAQPEHINESVRIRYVKDISDETILQAALSQKQNHSFYTFDLFTGELLEKIGREATLQLNKRVRQLLLQCPCIRELPTNSANRRSYVYIGKKEAK